MTTGWQWTGMAMGFALSMAACATTMTPSTESLLGQAGFRQVPADSPQKVAHLQTLPEHRLIARTYQGKKYYVYSDPQGCKCLYIGNPTQYQSYQTILKQQQQAAQPYVPPGGGGVEEDREWEIANSGLQ